MFIIFFFAAQSDQVPPREGGIWRAFLFRKENPWAFLWHKKNLWAFLPFKENPWRLKTPKHQIGMCRQLMSAVHRSQHVKNQQWLGKTLTCRRPTHRWRSKRIINTCLWSDFSTMEGSCSTNQWPCLLGRPARFIPSRACLAQSGTS